MSAFGVVGLHGLLLPPEPAESVDRPRQGHTDASRTRPRQNCCTGQIDLSCHGRYLTNQILLKCGRAATGVPQTLLAVPEEKQHGKTHDILRRVKGNRNSE